MNWFSNVKISYKLIIGFGLLALIMLIFACFAILQIYAINNDVNELINSHLLRQITITEAMTDVYKMRYSSLSRGYLVEGPEYYRLVEQVEENYEENARAFLERLYGFRTMVIYDQRYNEEERNRRTELVNEIEEAFIGFILLARKIEAAALADEKEEIISLYDLAIPAGNDLTIRMQLLLDLLFTASSEKIIATTVETARAIRTIITIAIIFILVAILSLFFTVKNISQPISNLKTAATAIALGDLDFPIRSDRKDEFGMLSNRIGDMVEEIKTSINAAETASNIKSSFLANMSHEIRTPLNAIMGITEILMFNKGIAVENREALSKIYGSGDMLLNIINDILDFSRIEAGKLEITLSNYELPNLIKDIITLNLIRIGNKPIEFELSVEENTPSNLYGDELRIKQVLNNLLSNAFKYTDTGKIKLSIFGESETDSTVTLVFEVIDTGKGMTEEQLSKLFDAYTRFNIDENRTIEGAGLGMNITRDLLNLMNGEIKVQSEPGKGSVFTVHLPQKKINTSIIGKETANNLEAFRTDDLKQVQMKSIVFESMPYGTVLVIDDVESNLYVARGLLTPYALNVDTASSGIEAIEKIKESRTYDIIFMDHMMPKPDGIETTKIIRSMGYTDTIIALTANAVVGQSDIFLANGFDSFISKPVDLRQLNALLKKYVRDKKTQTGGSALLEAFIRDAERSIKILEEIREKHGTYDDEFYEKYIVNTHAMKSALANVDEHELSELAGNLEKAGRERNIEQIEGLTKNFIEDLRTVIRKYNLKQADPLRKTFSDYSYLHQRLNSLKNACEDFDKKRAKGILADLREKAWQSEIKDKLIIMAEYLLNGDFEELLALADTVIKETSA